MKRLSKNMEDFSSSKKHKMSKEEKKLLRKEALKFKTGENKKNKIISDQYQGDCVYYFQNGFRKVHPYFHTFQSNIKERWLNKSVKEVFENDFYSNSPLFVKSQIENKNLLINNKETNLDYILKPNDVITHRVHRHELPVLDEPINIIHESDTVLVVCKPSSMPVHSVSKYHFNTVMGILHKSHGIQQLRVIHRIDRMTSGILLFGKDYETSSKLSGQIRDRQVLKYYLAVVGGKFNEEKEQPIECNKPLGILCPKVGLAYLKSVEEGGKIASTKFMFLKYNEKQNLSLVLCKPLTGRTHQIRVHLQYLGFPISNDPLYNCISWGKDKGKCGVYHKSKEQLIEDLMANHDVSVHRFYENGNPETLQTFTENKSIISDEEARNKYFEPSCDECLSRFSCNEDVDNFVLFLHAYRYRTVDTDWDYRTDIPNWVGLFALSPTDKDTLINKLEFLTGSDCDIFD